MLRVYHSNRLDVLEALMEFIVERERLDDPFEPEMILVQSTGMAQWLQMTLAQKFSIAANIDFPLPASFIWDMFVRVLPDIPKESAFSKQSMSWKLMTLLPQLLDGDDFALLRHYLTDDTDKRKLFQLSSRAADLFDQYLVYRPDWLTQWEAGDWLRTRRVSGLAGTVVESAGGIHRGVGPAALASCQFIPTIYSDVGKRVRVPAGTAFSRLYLRHFGAAAGLFAGIAGAG
jgi:exodeoxyribonuclease V gamma subunit